MEHLHGLNIVVFDLEIKKTIEQCSRGWASHDEMGISVGCAFDYRDNRYRVFLDDNICELVERLNEPDTTIVAFNHINFDNRLLRASGHPLREDSSLNNYDMLLVSRSGAGSSGNKGGFKLDDHLRACNLPLKTANGALAPIWWQQGKIGAVIDYCLNDVMQEKALFEYMITHRKLSCRDYKDYAIELPSIFLEEAS